LAEATTWTGTSSTPSGSVSPPWPPSRAATLSSQMLEPLRVSKVDVKRALTGQLGAIPVG
jgi:hypothetical protein